MALGVGGVGDAMAAVPHHGFIVQSPRHPRLRRALHRAHQRHKLVDVVDLFAE